MLTAEEALDWGMVARLVPRDDLLDVAKELLAQCCRTAPAARGTVKASLDNYLGLSDRIGMQTSLFGPEAPRPPALISLPTVQVLVERSRNPRRQPAHSTPRTTSG